MKMAMTERETLLPFVYAEFAEHGLTADVFDGVSARAGMSEPEVRRLFPTVDDMLIALFGPEGFEYRGCLAVVDSAPLFDEPEEALATLLRGLAEISRRDHRILRAYRQRVPGNRRLMWAMRSGMKLAEESVIRLLRRHMPTLTAEDATIGYFLVGALMITANNVLMDDLSYDASKLHERQRRAVRLLLAGFQAGGLRTAESQRTVMVSADTLDTISDFMAGLAYMRANRFRAFESLASEDLDRTQNLCFRLLIAGSQIGNRPRARLAYG